MQNNKSTESNLGFEGLVQDLLGLDPAALISMDPKRASVAAGLHEFMRRTVQRALGYLWASNETTIRLRSDASAKALGWPDAKTLNLSSLFVWALVREPRRVRGHSPMPLCPVDAKIVDIPRTQPADESTSTAGLVAMAVTLFEVDIDAMRRTSGPSSFQPVSVCALIRETLGVAPEILIRSSYGSEPEVEEAFARDPEGQAASALSVYLMSMLGVYRAAVAQQIDCIRLLLIGDDDPRYQGSADARSANIATCLTAGLLAEGDRDIAFSDNLRLADIAAACVGRS